MLIIFFVFGLSEFPSERFAHRRFFQSSLSKTAFCVLVFFVTAFREIKPYGNLYLLLALGSGEQRKKRFHTVLLLRLFPRVVVGCNNINFDGAEVTGGVVLGTPARIAGAADPAAPTGLPAGPRGGAGRARLRRRMNR